MIKKITLFIIISLSFSCKNNDKQDIKDTEKDLIKSARFLIGSWKSFTEDGTLTEAWNKVNDSTYKGSSFFIKSTDTLHKESILLNELDEKLNYTTTILGQNNDKPISFPLLSATEKKIVFENKLQDYPQRITYTLISKDSVLTEISGSLNGRESVEKFILERVQKK